MLLNEKYIEISVAKNDYFFPKIHIYMIKFVFFQYQLLSGLVSVSLSNDISMFLGYLMPKLSLPNKSDTVQSITGGW